MKRQRNQRSNYQHLLDHIKAKKILKIEKKKRMLTQHCKLADTRTPFKRLSTGNQP